MSTKREQANAIYHDVKGRLGIDNPMFRQTVISEITSQLQVAPATASVYYYAAREQDGNPRTVRAPRSTSTKVANSAHPVRLLAAVREGEDPAFFLTRGAAERYANRRKGTVIRPARKADFE